jgi:ribonuclease P protein component
MELTTFTFMSMFTLSKSERLCSKKQIDDLFKTGKSLNEGDFRVVYKFTPLSTKRLSQALFSVPKRNNPKATRRNFIKRCMKESYRLNKKGFYNMLTENELHCALIIIFSGKEKPDFNQIEITIKKMFVRLINLGSNQVIKQ